MRRAMLVLPLVAILFSVSCAKKEETPAASTEVPKAPPAAPPAAEPAVGPRVSVLLKDGTKVPGTIVASSATDMVVAGANGIESRIPLGQIKSVEYTDSQTAQAPKTAPSPVLPTSPTKTEPPAPAAPARPVVTTKTFELPAGSEISVRTNEVIDSATAQEGQSFDAQVTRDAKDANGDIVIPRAADARIVIKSASEGGRFRGKSDLVLDLQSVSIRGKRYTIDTVDVTKEGKSGVGANKRTAVYTGTGAAVGAIIGAIAGGGKGAAIGAGAGAGAGVLTQVLTKGKAIKVPAESILTFSLDKSLKVVQRD